MIPIVTALLAQGLPLIANAFMSKGSEWIKEKTGVDLAEATLSAENVLKLKTAQMEHEVELLKLRQDDDRLSVELERAYLEDRQSARTMQVAALAQEDTFSKRFVYFFAIGWSVFAAMYISGVTFFDIPSKNIRVVDTVLGFMLGTLVSTIISFFFGSSKSSQVANETIAQTVKATVNNATQPAP